MSSRRILQQVLSHSMRLSVQRTSVPVLRASAVLSNNFIRVKDTKRFFNSQAPASDIFKVVDFNDIQNTIKNEGKVS